MKTLLAVILIVVTLNISGQGISNTFAEIDQRVRTIDSHSVDSLSEMLCAPYQSQLEKVRSIFKWITENIEYDVQGYQHPENVYAGLFRPQISMTDSLVSKDYNERIVQKVLSEKKAICDGYARLFKTLCDKANIQSEIISGHIRWFSDPIGVVTDRGHAWNAVFINGKWQLLDPTWASGSCDNAVTKFTKSYDDFYFLTQPIKFFNDHYPTDLKWALFPNAPTRKLFYYYPFFHHGFYESRFISYKPTNGIIEVTILNKQLRIELETGDIEKTLRIIEYPAKEDTINHIEPARAMTADEYNKRYAPKYKIAGKKIYWDYELQSDDTKRLDIVYNDKLVLSYTIKMYR